MTEFPNGWISTGFLNTFDIQGGTQPPKSEFIYEAKEGYVQLLQIRDFGARTVPTYVPETTKLKKCNEGDLLVARYGASLGRILTGMSGAYNVAMAKVHVPEQFNRRYVYYLLKSESFQAPLAMVSRSAQNGFNREDLAGFQVPIAPAHEQKRIADKLDTVLTRVDAVNTRLARVAPLLKRFRQSVLAAATSGRLTEDWRNSAGSRSVWQTTDVQSVAQVGTGSTPLRSNPGFFSSIGTPWVTSAATSSEIVTESNEYVTPEAIAAHRLKVFPVGTLWS